MGKAKFRLSAYRLEQLLGFPYETRITKIIGTPNNKDSFKPEEFIIYVENPQFPDAKSDYDTLEVYPTWNEITRREFVDWGILDGK